MNVKKTLKTVVIALTITAFIFAAWLYFLSVRHHSIAHEKLVTYLNKEFEGQVHFRDFSLSYLRKFPKIHVEILDVAILDQEKEILKIGDLDLMLYFGSIWKKQIRIDKAILSDVTFFSEIDSLGRAPLVLAAKSPSSDNVHKALIINAKKIKLRNGLICFRNDVKRNLTRIRVHSADLKLHSTDTVITISGVLDGHLDSLVSNNSVLFTDLPLKAKDISLEIHRQSGVKELKSGYLQSNNIILTPKLRLEPYQDGQLIHLQISGGERFDALLALFRVHLGFELAQVNPEAKLILSYSQNGFVNPFIRPFSELDFEISDAVFEEEDLPFPMELIYAKGNYNNGEGHSPKTVVLMMDTLYAEVNGSHLGGHFKLSNLHDPVIDAYLVSNLDMSHLIKETEVLSMKGMVDLNLKFNGRISELKKLHLEGKQQAYGVINFHNLELILKKEGYSVKIHNGTATLNNHVLEFSTIAGAFDESAFLFKGHVENLDQFVLHENEQLIGDFFLDFDELDIGRFNSKPQGKKKTNMLTSSLFAYIMVDLELNGKKLRTPLADLENLCINLSLANNILRIDTLCFDHAQGHVESSGQINFDENDVTTLKAMLDIKAFDGNTSAVVSASFDSTGMNSLIMNGSMKFQHFKPEEIINTLGLNRPDLGREKTFKLPKDLDIQLDFQTQKLTYHDLELSQTGFSVYADNIVIVIADLHSGLPFGQLFGDATLFDYQTSAMSIKGNVSLAIDNLDLEDLIAKEYLLSLTSSNHTGGKNKNNTDLPSRLDLQLDVTADHLTYGKIHASNVSLGLDYKDEKIELKKLDLEFAGGHIHLNGHLLKNDLQKYPGYVYLNANNIVLEDILEAFDNFDQEKFTSLNSSGEISMASHHYFTLARDFSFIRNANLWLGNVMIHKAEFARVEPIEKTLFFVGHKAKDTMMVSELNINLLLAKDKLYFRDVLMNDNIANLELSGYLDLDDNKMDLATEISLTDLFFRSKKERIAETQAGIITLDEDARLFVRLYGPMSDHKIGLMKKNKFEKYQADLHDKISMAEKEYSK